MIPLRKRGRIAIGCGSGYSHDRLGPAFELAASGAVDVLAFDCLAERTLALAQLRRRDDPAQGYDERLPEIVQTLAPHLREGLTVVGNFGAANIAAAVDVTLAGLRAHGAPRHARVGVIEGDDVLPAIRELDPRIEALGATVSELGDRVVSANAYLGAEPVHEALAGGVSWVLGGRIGDASLYVAPICAALGWALDDWDRVAHATLVGHVLECSTQCSGGYFADPPYRVVPGLWRLGFPFATVSDDRAVVTKLPGTGGVVNEQTVALQIAYEVHDPAAYLTPDVTASFAAAECTEVGPDRVAVGGATGRPRPDLVKVMVGVDRGFHAVGEVSYAGSGCIDRARLAAEVVAHDAEALGPEVEEVRYDLIGVDALVGGRARTDGYEPPEVRLRVAARVRSRTAADTLTRDVERLLLHGPAGGGGSSRSVTPALAVYGVLVPRETVRTTVTMLGVGD